MNNQMRVYFDMVDRVTGPLQSIQGNIDGFASRMNTLKKALPFAAIAGGALAAYNTMQNLTKEALAVGDNIHKASQRVGMGTEAFQALNRVLGLNGTSVEKLERQLVRLGDNAVRNAGKFRRMGIEIHDTSGRLLSNDKVIMNTLYTLADMEDHQLRNSYAFELMGQRAASLIPTLNNGRDAIKEWYEEAEELGLVLRDQTVQELARLNDVMSENETRMRNAKTEMAVGFAPILERISNNLSGVATGFREMFNPFDSEKLADIDKWIKQREDALAKLDAQQPDQWSNRDVDMYNMHLKILRDLQAEREKLLAKMKKDEKTYEKKQENEQLIKNEEEAAKGREKAAQKQREAVIKQRQALEDAYLQTIQNGKEKELAMLALKHERELEQLKGNSAAIQSAKERHELELLTIEQKYAEESRTNAEIQHQKSLEQSRRQYEQYQSSMQSLTEEWTDRKLATIRDRDARERAQLKEQFDRRKAQYIEGTNEYLMVEQIYQQESAALEQQIAQRKRQQEKQDQRDALSGLKNNLRTLAKEHKAAAVSYKLVAGSETMINAYKSATGAYAALAPIPVVGPVLGAGAYAAALASGLASVRQIAKQRFVSGGQAFPGMAVTGEQGREIVQFDQSAKVYNTYESNRIMNQKSDMHLVIQDQHGNTVKEVVTAIRRNQADELVSVIKDKLARAN